MDIIRIETGKVRVKQNQLTKGAGIAPGLLKVLLDKRWSAWLPIYAWVIDHSEGIIVVDTGDTYKTGVKGYLPKWHPYYAMAVDFDVTPEEEIGPQLRKLGIDPDRDINKVVLTHLHTDHAGGMNHFPNAEFIIGKKEYKAASGVTGIMAGYLPHRWPKWLNPTLVDLPNDTFGSFDQSMPLTKDGAVRLVATPGHVADHMSVIVERSGLYYFLAGDTSYTEGNMVRGIPDGIGTKASRDTLGRIQAFTQTFPTIYLPSHDPGVPERMDRHIPVGRELDQLIA